MEGGMERVSTIFKLGLNMKRHSNIFKKIMPMPVPIPASHWVRQCKKLARAVTEIAVQKWRVYQVHTALRSPRQTVITSSSGFRLRHTRYPREALSKIKTIVVFGLHLDINLTDKE